MPSGKIHATVDPKFRVNPKSKSRANCRIRDEEAAAAIESQKKAAASRDFRQYIEPSQEMQISDWVFDTVETYIGIVKPFWPIVIGLIDNSLSCPVRLRLMVASMPLDWSKYRKEQELILKGRMPESMQQLIDSAIRYLAISYKIDHETPGKRRLGLFADVKPKDQEQFQALLELILEIIHPWQSPIDPLSLQYQLQLKGFAFYDDAIKRALQRLCKQGELVEIPSPWKGKRFVYHHPAYRPTFQVGDRVKWLVRSSNSMDGTIVKFKRHWQTGRDEPIVRWDTKRGKPIQPYESFGNPEHLILLHRPEPFSQGAACI